VRSRSSKAFSITFARERGFSCRARQSPRPFSAARLSGATLSTRGAGATYIESEDPLPLPEIYRDLALHMEDSYDENSVRLQWLIVVFRLAGIALGVEILAWIVDLASA